MAIKVGINTAAGRCCPTSSAWAPPCTRCCAGWPCLRQSVPFLALRSASIASFAAAVAAWARPAAPLQQPDCGCGGPCLRHG